MKKEMKIPITKRALAQRINRKLATEGEKLVKARSERLALELGDYYAVDIGRNCVSRKDFELEGLGRQLGVLKPYEKVIE